MAVARSTATFDMPLLKPGKWEVNKDAMRAYTAAVARTVLKEEQRKGTFPRDKKAYITQVDRRNRRHGSEAEVRLGGRIAYLQFDYRTEFLPAALQMLRYVRMAAAKVSPSAWKTPGQLRAGGFRARHYIDSFALLRNNAVVVGPGRHFWTAADKYVRRFADALQPGEVLSIVNIQPYARKLESFNGLIWSTKSPRGILRLALSSARRGAKTKALNLYPIELKPLPGGISEREVRSQGATVTYAERRRDRNKWKYSGRLMRKHRVYPVLTFGPAHPEGGKSTQRVKWTHRPNTYDVLPSSAGIGRSIAQQLASAGAEILK